MTRTPVLMLLSAVLLPVVFSSGCSSPSHADQDAVFSGLAGVPAGANGGHGGGHSGTVTIDEVISMKRAGVQDDLVANHVRANGMVSPLQSGDLIRLEQEGVSPRVVAAMQEPTPRLVQAEAAQPSDPPPAIVDGYPYYYSPGWGLHYYPHVYYRWR
jgi:hypothetical protein